MRYCYENPGALGFVISQDGDIRAITRVADKLVLWENIDVELAFKAENGFLAVPQIASSLSANRAIVA